MDYSGYSFSRREQALIYSGIAVTGILIAYLFYRSIFFAVVILPFAGRLREFVRAAMVNRRKRALQEQFKDLLFMLSTAISAGRGMQDAIGESIAGMEGIYGKQALLVLELHRMYERMAVAGENDVDVLLDFALRSDSEDVLDFVSIYATCKKTGASLLLAMNKAASVIIDKMTIENEIREMVKRKRSEGLLLFLMPVAVILFLGLLAPEYIAPLYESVTGRILMSLTIAADIGIYAVIQKIVRVEI